MTYQVKTRLQSLPFKRNLQRYDEEEHREATSRQGDAAAADSRAAHVPVTGGLGGDSAAGVEGAQQEIDIADAAAHGFVKMMMTENLRPERAVAAALALAPRALKTTATVFGAPSEVGLYSR
jgi:hypothetical protein